MKKPFKYLFLLLVLALSSTLIITTFFYVEGKASNGWSRSLEPVVIEAGTMYFGVSPDHVFAYSYRGGTWEQIPLQIDEVDFDGEYVATNIILDPNDELVFMAKDLGDWAGVGNWIPDGDSRNYRRYQIEVTNPLDPAEVGYVYLYRSETLSKTHRDYVSYDDTNLLISTETYTLTFGEDFIGMDQISFVDQNQDVLDRSKFRLDVVCRSGGQDQDVTFTEVQLALNGEDLMELNPSIDGPVRAGGGNQDLHNWYYESLYDISFYVDFNALDDVICDWLPFVNFGYFKSFRYSLDWLNPEDTGMATMTYFDSNGEDGFEIDGTTDSVPDSPIPEWTQVSGNLGSFVSVTSVESFVTGSLYHYYMDDSTEDEYDTGDYKSFGDAGILAVWPPETPSNEYGTLGVQFLSFFLGPNQPNVGETYAAYTDPANALQAEVTGQEFEAIIFIPIIYR